GNAPELSVGRRKHCIGSETLMSRGPGKLQRAIKAVFEAEPENGFLLSELCEHVYRGVNRIEKKHRVAVARAAHKMPWLAQLKRGTLGGELVFYNPASVMAYGMARLKCDQFGRYERHSDPRFGWREPRSEADFRATLMPGGDYHKYIVEGGAWQRFAAANHAKCIGDVATYERLKREQEPAVAKWAGPLRRAFAAMPRRPQRPPIVGYRLGIANADGTFEYREFKSRRVANKVAMALDGDTVCYCRIERIYGDLK